MQSPLKCQSRIPQDKQRDTTCTAFWRGPDRRGGSRQYGVTGGQSDGSVVLRYGSVDVALGLPLSDKRIVDRIDFKKSAVFELVT